MGSNAPIIGNNVIDFTQDRFRDVVGRIKTTQHQNVYEADFEYGPQPLRWEAFTANGGTVTHLPAEGGVQIAVPTTNGAVALRQSRPYQRYQPGKTMFMATAALFGPVTTGNRQRIGFFDDANGVFFEQGDASAGNPAGMAVVVRTDTGGTITETRITLDQWNGDSGAISRIDWTRIQMLYIEYAWYGAGAVRWGAFIDGAPYILHQVGFGNRVLQTSAWCRTGNLPVRYELRNVAALATTATLIHYGVSVLVEGGVDDQRGFTYSYGMAPGTPRRTVAANTVRFPVLSIRGRVMGTQEYTQASAAITSGTTTTLVVAGTPWTVNQWRGRCVAYGAAGAVPTVARIVSNTNNTLTIAHVVTGAALGVAPAAGNNYTIGLINRGQLLPRTLLISASALARVELIASIPGSPVSLTSPTWTALSSLGSPNSFAERDVSATGTVTGGEVVMAFTAPAGGSGLLAFSLDNLLPLVNTVVGNLPDTLTVAVSTPTGSASDVGCDLIAQEAMS